MTTAVAPETLDCYIGIDLGSTTTKAVVVNAAGAIIGRGITNSRSNYDIACRVARTEAIINTRFSLFRRALERAGLRLPVEDVANRLALNFKRQQHLSQYEHFCDVLRREAAAPRYAALGAALTGRLEEIFTGMRSLTDEAFRPGAPKRSDFFRDIAGSQYSRLAEAAADPRGASFDVLMSLYDKTILQVENHALDLSFQACIRGAFERTVEELATERGGRFDETDRRALFEAVRVASDTELRDHNTVGTGYGRARLPFPREQIRSEILCHGLGAHAMFPRTRTVLDIGGQDTKAIQVDDAGIVTSFQMNDRCAAGCGRYLGYIADEMNLGLHELGPMAMQSGNRVKINSTCTVFAGAELRERLAVGEKREDILSGLHRAIILRAMSLLARSGGVSSEFTFTGGVANNVAAVDALRKLVEENYGAMTINISPDSIYTGALGAALFAQRDGAGVSLNTPETAELRRSA